MGLMGMGNNNMMYLAGTPGVGAYLGDAADRFLNAWKTVGEEKRADATAELQKKIMAAQVEEYLNKQAMRQAMGDYYKGLMNPATVIGKETIAENMNNTGDVDRGYYDKGAPLLPVAQTVKEADKTYPSQLEAWKAQGLNPEQEALKGASGLLAGFDPEKALDLKTKLMLGGDKFENLMKIAMLNNLTKKEVQGLRNEGAQNVMQLKIDAGGFNRGSGREPQDKLQVVEMKDDNGEVQTYLVNLTTGDKKLLGGGKKGLSEKDKMLADYRKKKGMGATSPNKVVKSPFGSLWGE